MKIGEAFNVKLIIENQDGIEKITIGDTIIQANGRSKVALDRIKTEGEVIKLEVKTIGKLEQDTYILIVTEKPIIKITKRSALVDGVVMNTIEIQYPDTPNLTKYYSIDEGETWQEYSGTMEMETSQMKKLMAKIEYNEGITLNEPVKYTNKLDIAQTHTAHNLDEGEYNYSWEELEALAKLISDDNRVNATYTTPEVKVEMYGKEYTIGVGDYKNVIYNGESKRVRILGFNHDELATEKENEDGTTSPMSQYGEGTTNTYAGISFEFVDFIMKDRINATNTNVGGWGATEIRTKLNSLEVINNIKTTNGISIGEKIKEVEKEYNVGNMEKRNDISKDKLWLIACSEIWKYAAPNCVAGECNTSEGKRYEYYEIYTGNAYYQHQKQTGTLKPTAVSKWGWMLRSPYYNNTNSFCYITLEGDEWLGVPSALDWGIAPGFCI